METTNNDNINIIKHQYGGFIGSVTCTNEIIDNINIQKNNFSKKEYCINGIQIIFNVKTISVLIFLILYIYIGGIVYQIFELSNENILHEKYNLFFSEIKSNLSDYQYNKLFIIANINHPDKAYNYWNNIENSMFFAFTLVSTIGYGNTTPLTDESKIFTLLYILLGVPLGAYSFGLFAAVILNLITWCSRITTDPILRAYKYLGLRKEDNITPSQLKLIMSAMKINVSDEEFNILLDDIDIDNDGFISYNELKLAVEQRKWDIYNILRNHYQLLYIIIQISIYLLIGMFTFHFGEGWGYLDSFYFCIITITTIGLGDLYPENNKLSVFIFSCVGLGLIALLIRFSCEVLIEKSKRNKFINSITHRDLINSDKKIYNKTVTYKKILQNYKKMDNIKVYRYSNIVWAIKLKEKIQLIVKNENIIGNINDWFIQSELDGLGSFNIMKNDRFNKIYEKIKKRNINNKCYRLKIKLLCKKVNINDPIKYIQIRKNGIDIEKKELEHNEYIVYDIISDTLVVIKKKDFEKDFEIDNHTRINFHDLKIARHEIYKID